MNLDLITNTIKYACEEACKPLEYVALNGPSNTFTFSINLLDLEDYNGSDIRQSEKHKELFERLESIKSPVVYVIRFASDHNTQVILDAFKSYQQTPLCKATPALRNTPFIDTTTLYVGKVKSKFWWRLITHLGFYRVHKTQGLQLFYWAKDIGLKLDVTVYEFNNEMANYIPIIENAVARELKPLIGKHDW